MSGDRPRPLALARAGLMGLVDLVLPPRCLGCGALVPGPDSLCAPCWGRVRFITPPLCAGCGHPLAIELAGPVGCPACHGTAGLDRVRAAVAYDDASRGLVLAFKHGGRIGARGLLGRWLAEAGQEVLREADLLLPVPLHRWRLVRRGYNQAGLLAEAVARLAGVAFAPDLLRRVRATRSQQGLGARARGANVTAAAFGLAAGGAARIAGRRVVLVDDVLTTGATLAACAAVLRHGGASRVEALVLARVVRDLPHTI